MKKYYSKVDWFLAIPLIYPLFLSLIYALQGKLYGVFAFLGLVSIVIYASKSTYYSITENILIVKSLSIVNQKIDITKISKIEKSKTWLSSPALSLDRIKIKYNKFDEIYISPKEKEEFMKDILKVNPQILVNLT